MILELLYDEDTVSRITLQPGLALAHGRSRTHKFALRRHLHPLHFVTGLATSIYAEKYIQRLGLCEISVRT